MKKWCNTRWTIISTMLSIGIIVNAQSILPTVTQEVSKAEISAHLKYLASDALKGRGTGSDGQNAAAEHIIAHFRMNGINSLEQMEGFRQNVKIRTIAPPVESSLTINNRNYTFPDDFIILNNGQNNLQAEALFIGHGNQTDVELADLRLKVAVSLCGNGVSNNPREWMAISEEKRRLVKDAGAVGLIEIYADKRVPWRMMKRFGTSPRMELVDEVQENIAFPHVWIGGLGAEDINMIKEKAVGVNMGLQDVVSGLNISSNVVGFVEGTDEKVKEEYIIYSAHYDHVGIGRADAAGDTIYNGARDNAVGVVSVMMLAKYFAKHPPKRSSLFVLFTAEEKGLLGSRWFANNSPIPLDKVVYNYNIDNGGYNDTSIVSVVGLTRTTAEVGIQEAVNELGLEAIEDPAKEQGLFDRSDNVNFAKNGIPAPTFSMGFREFDQEIFKYYHQPGDHVESLNMNYITKFVWAYILSSNYIANMNERPFWLEGDKYYKAGIDLYKPD